MIHQFKKEFPSQTLYDLFRDYVKDYVQNNPSSTVVENYQNTDETSNKPIQQTKVNNSSTLKSSLRFSPKVKQQTPPFFNFLVTRTYDQLSGPWPEEHPLPLPVWSEKICPVYKFENIIEFEVFASLIENTVQHLLQEHNYNSITNFLKLYMDFKRSATINLAEFFQKRTPEITNEHLTCVGLGLELRKRISNYESKYPGLTECLYMASSEENVENLPDYTNTSNQRWAYTVEKEHVVVALKIDINGRKGVLLCDPGYHVARVIIVMEDEAYPHTGKFVQSEESSDVIKEYEYRFNKSNPLFIDWIDSETKQGVEKHQISLIYIQHPYLSAIDLTERRNFVYDFRSLLARDMKGHLIAGIYFPLKKGRKDFTIFYRETDGQKKKIKMDFDDFLDPDQLDEQTLKIVEICNEQLQLSTEMSLLQHLVYLAYLINDADYINQILTINKEINDMT